MLETLIAGGWMMVPLMACSVVALAVVMDRGVAFWRYGTVDTRSLRAQVRDLLRHGQIADAALLCSQTPGPVAAVMLVGIQAYQRYANTHQGRDLAEVVKAAMEDYTAHAMNGVEKRFLALTTIGTAAPLLGMTGTVTGMIASFGGMMEGGVTTSVVAGGISEALITTAAGLLIALGAVIPYNYFLSRSSQIELELSEVQAEYTDLIIAKV